MLFELFILFFIADVIIEKYNTKELYQKLKFLDKLKDQEKKDLEDYFLEKVKQITK